jgi:molybdenum cofactor cytidylyltransferase
MTPHPGIAALILAAGRSTRMGPSNKLLADVRGRPLLRHVAEAALASRARPVLVVVGHQAAAVKGALAALDVIFVDNPAYAAGLSTSLRAGVRALPPASAGVLVLLGDMPQITSAHIDALIAAFGPAAIVVPTHGGKRGNPVLWPAARFGELLGMEGDAGAKPLLAAHAGSIIKVELGSDAIFADVDTPEALGRLSSEVRGRSA